MSAGVKPHRATYLLPVVFLVAVGIPAVIWLVEGINGIRSPLKRIVAPGSTAVDLHKAGDWTVFYEYRSTVDGRFISTDPDPPSLEISIVSAAGDSVFVDPSSTPLTYETGRSAGVSIATFEIAEPGSYEVTVEDDAFVPRGEMVIAFGHEKGRAVGRTILGGVLLGSAVLVTLLAVGLIFFLRVRSRRKLDFPSPPYAAPPPPPGH